MPRLITLNVQSVKCEKKMKQIKEGKMSKNNVQNSTTILPQLFSISICSSIDFIRLIRFRQRCSILNSKQKAENKVVLKKTDKSKSEPKQNHTAANINACINSWVLRWLHLVYIAADVKSQKSCRNLYSLCILLLQLKEVQFLGTVKVHPFS